MERRREPELPSLLQERWDRRWRSSGKVMLILCGSYVGFMEREVLGRQSPLFGRRTGQILLRPFSHLEAAQFHPALSLVDRARTYFVCGGIPYYLRFFSDQRSIEMNLAAELLTEHAALFREPDFLLREELREVENYYAVLLAVATGKTSHQAIARETQIAPQSLHYYLQQLTELGYLARRYPLAGKTRAARHVRFDVADPLLRFWFRFVFPNTSYLQHMGAERALRDRIAPHLEAYFGHCFERLCREALPVLYRRERVTAAFEIGEFWSKDVQIDVVGLRDDGWTDLGECKWGEVGSRSMLTRELEERARAFPNPRQATIARRIFTREKPPRATPEGVRWHSLEDLYAPVQ
ncbi:MAG: ATP-binding protein [Thermoanaerobaculia bacterium]|nr:ATP-binding protein [Thermoanaerobaculia bacterium]